MAQCDSSRLLFSKSSSTTPQRPKGGDREKLRDWILMWEFEEYRQSRQQRLSELRLEAVRARFRKAWTERDYPTIIAVAGRIPEKVLHEDSQASYAVRLGNDPSR